MKSSEAKAIITKVTKNGWVKNGNRYYTPEEAERLGLNKKQHKPKTRHVKTGDINDTRNIRNKENQVDTFVRLIKQELGLEVWPEYHFVNQEVENPDPDYRLDYAIPEYMICVEQDGGIFMEKSGHKSITGILRDQDKLNQLTSRGWRLIRIIPDQKLSTYTLDLIKRSVKATL